MFTKKIKVLIFTFVLFGGFFFLTQSVFAEPNVRCPDGYSVAVNNRNDTVLGIFCYRGVPGFGDLNDRATPTVVETVSAPNSNGIVGISIACKNPNNAILTLPPRNNVVDSGCANGLSWVSNGIRSYWDGGQRVDTLAPEQTDPEPEPSGGDGDDGDSVNDVGDGGSAAPQNGAAIEAQAQTVADIQDNPIYERLQQIVNFLSVGVAIVITMSGVFAGYQYITSRGEPAKTKAAVERLWNIGIAIFLYIFMYVIIQWLIPGGTILS